jgi:hypothetical protein
MRRHLVPQAVLIYALCGALAGSAWALHKSLKTKAHNYPKAPVEVKRSSVELVETFTAPTQYVAADTKAKTSRVRYANRAGLTPSIFILQGETTLLNTSSQPVEAFSLTIVALDAFHQPLQTGSGGAAIVQQVTGTIPRGGSKRHEWQETVASPDVYEVAVVVTRVRFSDGKVWAAPSEELLDVF